MNSFVAILSSLSQVQRFVMVTWYETAERTKNNYGDDKSLLFQGKVLCSKERSLEWPRDNINFDFQLFTSWDNESLHEKSLMFSNAFWFSKN